MQLKKRNLFRTDTLILVGAILLSSCGLKDRMVSPGRVKLNEVEKFQNICDDFQLSCKNNNLEVVGHQAGSYRHYPMDFSSNGEMIGNNWSKSCRSEIKPIATLMGETFAEKDIKSIEIDVHASPKDGDLCKQGNCLHIIHNVPNWKKLKRNDPAVAYLTNNTLKKSLDSFIEQKFHQHHYLYLEVKAKKKCNNPIDPADPKTNSECEELVTHAYPLIAGEIEAALNKTSDTKNKWLRVVSFSASALQVVHEQLPVELRDKVEFALIAGVQSKTLTSGVKWYFGQAKGSVPMFRDELQGFAATTKWLDKIWFSIQGIPNYGDIFYKIAVARHMAGLKSLEFNVATYTYNFDKFKEKLASGRSKFFDLPITSMMMDIESEYTCVQEVND